MPSHIEGQALWIPNHPLPQCGPVGPWSVLLHSWGLHHSPSLLFLAAPLHQVCGLSAPGGDGWPAHGHLPAASPESAAAWVQLCAQGLADAAGSAVSVARPEDGFWGRKLGRQTQCSSWNTSWPCSEWTQSPAHTKSPGYFSNTAHSSSSGT